MNPTDIFVPESFPDEWATEHSLGPFEIDSGSLELEEEYRRGGRRLRSSPRRSRPTRVTQQKRPGSPTQKYPKPPVPPRRGRSGRRWAPWGVVREPFPVDREPALDSGDAPPHGSEHVRWAQDCLNRVMSARLPVDGVMAPATRSIVRSFQQRERLPVTGIVGPDTEEALKRACASAPAGGDADQEWGLETEGEGIGGIFRGIARGVGSTYGRVADVLGKTGGRRIIDLTAQADTSLRKGTRDPTKLHALVLHQMACCFRPSDPLKRFLRLNAHFAILADGRILQLHPVSALLWASNGFNARSVAVEFAGNFPNIYGKWWEGDRFGRNRPTSEQFEAGRYLVRYLINTMGLTHILAHRQSSNTRDNDPGPDIWYHVGQWAVERLHLKDGGPGYKHPAGGKPIPEQWRNWGRGGAARAIRELWETETAELWQGEPEGPRNAEVSFLEAIAQARKIAQAREEAQLKGKGLAATTAPFTAKPLPGIYTVYQDGEKLYVGKSQDLRRRMQQHLLCLRSMGISDSRYKVKLTPMWGSAPDQLTRVESTLIKKWGRRRGGGMLTNAKTRELEEEIRGEMWN